MRVDQPARRGYAPALDALVVLAAESRWVEAHGLGLHCLDWGGAGRQPLLLLNGLQDCAALRGTFAGAVQDGYHVMALDHRGHGESPWAGSYRLSDYVREVGDVIDALALQNVVLVGHSVSSKNALIHVAQHTERVSKLVITDMDPDAHNPGSVAIISPYKAESDEYPDIAAVVERLPSRQPRSSEEVLTRFHMERRSPRFALGQEEGPRRSSGDPLAESCVDSRVTRRPGPERRSEPARWP